MVALMVGTHLRSERRFFSENQRKIYMDFWDILEISNLIKLHSRIELTFGMKNIILKKCLEDIKVKTKQKPIPHVS